MSTFFSVFVRRTNVVLFLLVFEPILLGDEVPRLSVEPRKSRNDRRTRKQAAKTDELVQQLGLAFVSARVDLEILLAEKSPMKFFSSIFFFIELRFDDGFLRSSSVVSPRSIVVDVGSVSLHRVDPFATKSKTKTAKIVKFLFIEFFPTNFYLFFDFELFSFLLSSDNFESLIGVR